MRSLIFYQNVFLFHFSFPIPVLCCIMTLVVLCNRKMPDYIKEKVNKTVIRPVTSTECWPTTVQQEQRLHVMEMKMLWWTLGLTCWDHFINKVMWKILEVEPINEKILEAHLWWYEHVAKIRWWKCGGQDSPVIQLKPQGTMQKAKRKQWLDRIKEDLQHAAVDPEDALDWKKWRMATKERRRMALV